MNLVTINNLSSNVKERTKYRCVMCNQTFEGMNHLKQHMKIHTEEMLHDLSLPNKSYSSNEHQECNAYRTKVMKTNKTNLKINILEITFSNVIFVKKCFSVNFIYNRHIKMHSGEKTHECDVCYKKFARSDRLSHHKKIHSGYRQHECDECHKKFVFKGDLEKHRHIHCVEKHFECEICHKRFALKHYLSQHKYIHSRDKSYQCDICPKKFTRKRSLSQHKNIHQVIKVCDIKLHECDVCLKQLCRKFNLNMT